MRKSPSRRLGTTVALVLLVGCSSTAELNVPLDPDAAAIEQVGAPDSLEPLDTTSDASALPGGGRVVANVPEATESSLTAAEDAFIAVASPGPSPGRRVSRTAEYGPGITDHVIHIGAPVPHQTSPLNETLYQEADRPNFERVWRVVTNAINSTGGILGRRLEVNLLHLEPTAEEICSYFTEEQPVIAVIGYPAGNACLDDAGIASITHGYALEPEFYREAPHALSTLGISLWRVTKLYIDGLYQQGFFDGDVTIGMLRWDSPPFPALSERLVRPMLASYGLHLEEEIAISDPGNSYEAVPKAQAEGRQAVATFKDAGVDRVLALDSGSYMLPEITDYAEAQGYRPRYGLNSLNGGEWDMERKQLKGAVGVGWMPWLDLEPRHAYRHGNDAARRCKDLMDAAGESDQMDTYNEAIWTSSICDGVLLLKAAIEAGAPDITADSIIAGAESLGTSFQVSNTLLTRYGPGRHEGVAAIRFLRWFVGCQCFRYTSGLLDAG